MRVGVGVGFRVRVRIRVGVGVGVGVGVRVRNISRDLAGRQFRIAPLKVMPRKPFSMQVAQAKTIPVIGFSVKAKPERKPSTQASMHTAAMRE